MCEMPKRPCPRPVWPRHVDHHMLLLSFGTWRAVQFCTMSEQCSMIVVGVLSASAFDGPAVIVSVWSCAMLRWRSVAASGLRGCAIGNKIDAGPSEDLTWAEAAAQWRESSYKNRPRENRGEQKCRANVTTSAPSTVVSKVSGAF